VPHLDSASSALLIFMVFHILDVFLPYSGRWRAWGRAGVVGTDRGGVFVPCFAALSKLVGVWVLVF